MNGQLKYTVPSFWVLLFIRAGHREVGHVYRLRALTLPANIVKVQILILLGLRAWVSNKPQMATRKEGTNK